MRNFQIPRRLAVLSWFLAAAIGCSKASPEKCVISGELFVTTKGGDVKKAAGLSVRLRPVTPEFQEGIKGLHTRIAHEIAELDRVCAELKMKYPHSLNDSEMPPAEKERNKAMEEQYEKEEKKYREETYYPHSRPLWAEAERFVQNDGIEASTNADGKFRIEAGAGTYLLTSDTYSLGGDKLAWCKVVRVSGSESTLSLDQKAAIFRPHPTHPVEFLPEIIRQLRL